MSKKWPEMQLHRVQVRTRHASDLLVGTLVALEELDQSEFRERIHIALSNANALLVHALTAINTYKRETQEKQENGQA